MATLSMNEGTRPLPQAESDSDTGGDGCQRGHEFDAFLRREHKPLVYFLRARLPTEQDAEDVAQESMTRLVNYHERGEPPNSWYPLLYRIAVNVAHDHGRKARFRRANDHVTYEEILHATASDELPQDERLARQQTLECLWAIVRRLPERTQEIYVLSRIDGMSYSQIARHAGISAKSVEKHMGRALAALRQGMGDLHLEPL